MTRPPDLFDLVNAREAGANAADACAESAERQGWDAAAAGQFVLDYLRVHGETSGETLVTEASKRHPAHDARAYGAVLGRLSRQGKIAAVGHALRRNGHGTAGGRVWRLVEG